jgi:hypothetical protein
MFEREGLIGIDIRFEEAEPGTVNHNPVAVRLAALDSSRQPA